MAEREQTKRIRSWCIQQGPVGSGKWPPRIVIEAHEMETRNADELIFRHDDEIIAVVRQPVLASWREI